MFTRNDYLDGKCSHREYYAQFVTKEVKDIILTAFSETELLNSQDEWLNDLELIRWYSIYPSIVEFCPVDKSLSFSVCLAKEAAKQIIEELNKTKVCVENLKEYGNEFTTSIKDKTYKARQSGKIKRWKRNPEKFLIPVKYGLYENFYIANFDGWYNGKLIVNNVFNWKIL